jgi:Ca-activated chloride channel family protein
MRPLLLLILTILPLPATACGLALVLAVDVSGSVDQQEYRIQMDGLAAALRDGIVVDALTDQQAQVSLIQWSGSSRQEQLVPWTKLATDEDVHRLADAIEAAPRRWRNYSTAIGEALALAVKAFETLEKTERCERRVIDVSGDGISNEGPAPQEMRQVLRRAGIKVNALAIEEEGGDLTAYFYEHLIEGEGAFVITAQGFQDYPAQIRRKLQRETTKQLSRLLLSGKCDHTAFRCDHKSSNVKVLP